MPKPSGLGLAMVAAGAVASVPAMATPVTVTHSVALNTLIQGSGTTTLQFDLGSFLSSEGYNPSEVIGGTVSVFGFSEASYAAAQYGSYTSTTSYAGSHTAYYAYTYQYSYQYSYAYSCGFWGGSTCYAWATAYAYATAYAPYAVSDYNVVNQRDVLHTDAVADRMQVSTGNTVSTDTASQTSSSATPFSASVYTGTSGGCYSNSAYSCYYYYNRERDVYSAVYGNLDVTQSLDAAALLDLTGDGMINIGFGAPVGQYNLNSVSFDLVVQQALAQAAGPGGGQVPEPSDLPLTALALGAALAAGHLHRRRKAKP